MTAIDIAHYHSGKKPLSYFEGECSLSMFGLAVGRLQLTTSGLSHSFAFFVYSCSSSDPEMLPCALIEEL